MRLRVARARAAVRLRDAEAAERAIGNWLLDGNAQLRTGPHAGGVAGAIDADGRPLYLYPEITGYYLQWLAWRASRYGAAPAIVQRAAAAQRWLTAWIERTDPPETRVYPRVHEPDWRNSASFLFDLAMVLRGVASATAARLIEPDERLVAACVVQLSRLVMADGAFAPCIASSSRARLPDRWSTQRGGFLAKAAAGVLVAARVLPLLPATLKSAAEATLAASLCAAVDRPHQEVHPQLYAVEGALAMAMHPAVVPILPRLPAQIDALLREAGVDGCLRESRAVGGADRMDIVAQCLRAAHLLRVAVPCWSPDEPTLVRMQQTLVRNISADGAVAFSAATTGPPYSVWAAMFAEQALAIARCADADLLRQCAAEHLV
ncbi:MAG: hypothetical protein ABIR73_02945 [Usitatibacter sp.]